MLNPGYPIYISHQLFNGATDKYVKAHVYDATGTEVSGSPVTLSHVARGLYVDNGTLSAPAALPIRVQCLVYSDSGYLTLDSICGIGLDYQGGLETENDLAVGSAVCISAQMVDGASDVYVRAHAYDATGAELADSPVDLTHLSNGLYVNNGTLTMPDTPVLRVQTKVYTDPDYEVASTDCGDGLDLFYKAVNFLIVSNVLSGTTLTGQGPLSGILKG